MSRQNANQLRVFFYLLWIILSLFQAAYTELLDDEAYYWKFSTSLEWGYYEHPPLIALLIRCGFLIFKNELGARLLPTLLTVGTVFLTERLIRPKNQKLFFVIVSSVAILQLAGFFAIPDTPLIFFSVVFFTVFKKYLESDNLLNSILLALSMSLLLYSKYNGILIIVISLLSDVGIFKRKTFWFAIGIAVLSFLPHILWQISNEFPTIKYHLLERSSKSYDILHTLNYIFTQPFVFGPFIGIFFIYSLFIFRPANLFEKVMRNNAVGILAFFLVMTFKGRVEANWTWIAIFPLIYIVYSQAEIQLRMRKLIYLLFPFTIVSIMFSRLYMIWDYLPPGWKIKTEFHGSRIWTAHLSQVAGNTPVAFMNFPQQVSKYEFYTGKKSFSLNTGLAKKTQFSLWDSEYEFQGKKVLMVLDYRQKNLPSIQTSKGSFAYTFINNFRSFGNINVTPAKIWCIVSNHQPVYIGVKLNYVNKNTRDFESEIENSPSLGYVIYQKNKKIATGTTGPKISDDFFQNKEYEVMINPPPVAGEYDLYAVIKNGWLPPSIRGGHVKMIVTNDSNRIGQK